MIFLPSMPQLALMTSFGLASFTLVASSFGSKTTENHRVDRTDSGAGKHRDDCLGDHRHVDDDTITLGDSETLQDSGEDRHFIREAQHRCRFGLVR